METDHLVEEYKQKIADGLDPERLIEELNSKGVSILDAIKIVRAVLGISLGVAKQRVSDHKSWRETAERSKPIQDEFYEGYSHDAD